MGFFPSLLIYTHTDRFLHGDIEFNVRNIRRVAAIETSRDLHVGPICKLNQAYAINSSQLRTASCRLQVLRGPTTERLALSYMIIWGVPVYKVHDLHTFCTGRAEKVSAPEHEHWARITGQRATSCSVVEPDLSLAFGIGLRQAPGSARATRL